MPVISNEEGQVTKGTLCVKGTGYKDRIEDEIPYGHRHSQ